jgi:hypothetical protein
VDVLAVREDLEADLAWRMDELRHLRNSLLGDFRQDEWPAVALRSILVMQYAHLEGLTRTALAAYAQAVNEEGLLGDDLQPQLFASSLAREFKALRGGAGDADEADGKFTKRAKREVDFVIRLRTMSEGPVAIDPDDAVSMEMNLGRDVLQRSLFSLGIPPSRVEDAHYRALEFVRRCRNDVAHGGRNERVEPGLYLSHQRKCEDLMHHLVRLVTQALTDGWYRAGQVAVI